MTHSVIPAGDPALGPSAEPLTFNFALVLPGRASSYHTQRAYFRWVDAYLVDVAGLRPSDGLPRLARMSALPINTLRRVLSASQLRAWLGILAGQGHGKQGLAQARAALVTLAGLLAEAGWLDDTVPAAMKQVRVPKAPDGQRAGRWLSRDELRLLIGSAQRIATSDSQAARNAVVMTILCTMGLRREELAAARWGDLSSQNNRVVLRVHGKGKKTALLDVPRPVLAALEHWQHYVAPGKRPEPSLPLVTRLWKGGRVSRQALTAEGIWRIIHEAAAAAGLGAVAPHDLRRSVAGALQEAGVPIDTISRLLRHSNVGVTERYLSKLPQRNQGALLMSDMLGLDED